MHQKMTVVQYRSIRFIEELMRFVTVISDMSDTELLLKTVQLGESNSAIVESRNNILFHQ